MIPLLSIVLALLTLQSADDAPLDPGASGGARAAAHSDGEIAELVKAAIVSDVRARGLSADQFGRAANVRPDVDVARDVETALRDKMNPAPTNLSISSSAGNVQLRGNVANDSDLREATALAKGVSGVRGVLNRMSYPDQAAPSQGAADAPAKLPTRTAPFPFLTSDGFAGNGIVVDVKDGEVIIRGIGSSAGAREYVTSSASRVPGSRIVKNQMTLRPVAPREDQRLAQLVTKKLQWEQDLHDVADGISVAVRNGILRLTGTVDTEQQANQVRQMAADTAGILVVDDRLQVAAPAR